MPDVLMKRIHFHWTVGWHKANSTDLKAYHILVEGDGKLVRGNTSIAANARGSGVRAVRHTLNANTEAIGVSLCCMVRAKEQPFEAGPNPMTKVQWDTGVEVIAQLARRYAIPVTHKTILTHAEVGPNLNIPQQGKWDITRLAFDDSVHGYKAVGDRMRREVAETLDRIDTLPNGPPSDVSFRLPRFKVSGVAPSQLNFRDAPGGNKVGALPEGTRVERLGVVDNWWRVRTPAGFVGWVWSDFLLAA